MSDCEQQISVSHVSEGGVTYTPPDDSPDRQIVQTVEPPSSYYSLRVTVPRTDLGRMQEILSRHTKNYCMAWHCADEEVKHEHVHMCILEFTDDKATALKRALANAYKRQGNEFYAGSFKKNGVYSYLTYCKHDDHVDWHHRGSHWPQWIDHADPWVERRLEKLPEVSKKRKESDPVLTFSNLLWRAEKHRKENNIQSTDLGVTLEHMTRTTRWTPAPHIMKNGLDPLHFKLFKYRVEGCTGPTPNWWTPKHVGEPSI